MLLKSVTTTTTRLFCLFGISLGCLIVSPTMSAQEKSAASVYNDGLALLKAKDYESGLTAMEEALAMAQEINDEKIIGLAMRNGSVAAYNVGNARSKDQNYEGAIKAYIRGIELSPENSSLYEGLARVYEEQGESVKAVTEYVTAGDKGIAENKADRAESRYKRAGTIVGKLYVAKDFDTAVAAGEAFIALKKDDADVYYYVSRAHAEKGSNELALEHINTAISLSGDSVNDKFYYALASTLEAVGKNDEAVTAYKKITDETYKAHAEYRIRELGGK